MTTLSAAGAPGRRPPGTDRPDLVCVGGVPGAGKSTAIRQATAGLDQVVALDPEQVQRRLARVLPGRLPYRTYRWAVHTVHTLRVGAHLIADRGTGRVLVVHEPCTRHRRRRLFVEAARRLGWRPALVYVQADRRLARSGQRARGRLVPASSFERHWARWRRLQQILLTDPTRLDDRRWQEVRLVGRDEAAEALRALCGR